PNVLLRAVAIRGNRLKASAICRGNLEGNSGAHAPRFARFATEGNPKLDSYVRFEPLDPKFAFAYINRGTAYYNKQDYDRAFADYTRAIDLDSKLAAAYVGRGAVYYVRKDHDRAIEDYNRAIYLNPKMAIAYHNRGNAYKAQGNTSQASADYERAREMGYKE